MCKTMLFKEIIVILCFAYVLLLNVYNDSRRLQDIVSLYCPYTSLCHSPVRQIMNESEDHSCCANCSCEDDCWIYDNCCPDKETTPTSISGLVCKSALTKQRTSAIFGMDWEKEYNRYKIQASCPLGEKNTSLVQKCSGAINNSIDDIIWVSDKMSGTIYQNRYCALCHGVQDFTSWLLRTSCVDVLMTKATNIVKFILSDRCDIVNEAPKSEKTRARTFACDISDIGACNMTGQWDKYDLNIDEACNKYYWPYYDTSTKLQLYVLYRNVFCYACHKPEWRQISSDHCKDHNISIDRTDHKTFIAIIDLNDYLHVNTRQNARYNCGVNEVWDHYMVSDAH